MLETPALLPASEAHPVIASQGGFADFWEDGFAAALASPSHTWAFSSFLLTVYPLGKLSAFPSLWGSLTQDQGCLLGPGPAELGACLKLVLFFSSAPLFCR